MTDDRVPDINIGIFLAHTPAARVEALASLADAMIETAGRELTAATGRTWRFHREDPVRLESDAPIRPADLLDEATLRMAEGPFDVVIALTDVGLVSRRRRVVAGLASPVARVIVISTRRLVMTGRGQPTRDLAAPDVRRAAANILLHELGHVLGLDHVAAGDDLMAPAAIAGAAEPVSGLDRIRRHARDLPEREHAPGGWIGTLLFHLTSALRHPGQILKTLWRNRAPLLPLSLPSLATAAVAPMFILIFTAEIWDVGVNMTNREAWIFGIASIAAAVWYLTVVQDLFFPRKERRIVTEHMAVVNVTILLTILLAILGLFVMVGLIVLFIEYYVFPEGLISEWPSLELAEERAVTFGDRLRIASFVSTVSVITGALAGGLESRTVIRHLALFLDEP